MAFVADPLLVGDTAKIAFLLVVVAYYMLWWSQPNDKPNSKRRDTDRA